MRDHSGVDGKATAVAGISIGVNLGLRLTANVHQIETAVLLLLIHLLIVGFSASSIIAERSQTSDDHGCTDCKSGQCQLARFHS